MPRSYRVGPLHLDSQIVVVLFPMLSYIRILPCVEIECRTRQCLGIVPFFLVRARGYQRTYFSWAVFRECGGKRGGGSSKKNGRPTAQTGFKSHFHVEVVLNERTSWVHRSGIFCPAGFDFMSCTQAAAVVHP